MKVRVKLQDGQKRSPIMVTVLGDDPTIGELRAAVSASLEARTLPCHNCVLSLNGKDPLEMTEGRVTEAGIVSGDNLYVLYPDGVPELCCGQPFSPLVLSESTNMAIPAGLASLIEKASPNLQTATDYIAILVHYSMIENGFLPLPSITADHSEAYKSKYWSIPEDWKTPALYQFGYCYAHPHLQESSGVALMILKMSNCVVINAKTERADKALSMSVKTDTYIKDLACEFVAGRFQALKKYSAFFRCQITEPLVACLKEDAGITADILRLYPEVLSVILKKLDVKSVVAVMRCCRYLNSVSSDQLLWRFMLRRDFKEKSVLENEGVVDWKDTYKKSYQMQKRLSKAVKLGCADRMVAFHCPTAYPPPDHSHPIIPCPTIMGGQRDLYPTGIAPLGPGQYQPARPRYYPTLPGGGLPAPRREPDLFELEDPLGRRNGGRRFPSMFSDPFGGGSGFIL